MQQVLFFIPIRELAEWLSEIPAVAYFALAALAFGLSSWLDKRRNEGAATPRHHFRLAGSIVTLLLCVAGVIVLAANNIPARGVPIYGYGTMLFVAFVGCVWLACLLGVREGIPPNRIQDMAIWIFVFGIIGARLTFMFLAAPNRFDGFPTIVFQFFQVWDGGLVFYGSAVGGVIGYFLAYRFFLRKYGVSTWKMADIIAPCIALGLALGRMGCLLNGCCYGNVAVCQACPGIQFPLSSPPRYDMVERGYQTNAGFLTQRDLLHVSFVEPGSPAAQAGLKRGDLILELNHSPVGDAGDLKTGDLNDLLYRRYDKEYRGQNDLHLRVRHENETTEDLVFRPRTLALHPTQVYESVSMLLVLMLLLAYYPLRRQPGSVMVLLIFCYSVHRFLNEMLRTDTLPLADGLTLSQNISIVVLGVGVVLALWLRIKTVRGRGVQAPHLSAQPPVPA